MHGHKKPTIFTEVGTATRGVSTLLEVEFAKAELWCQLTFVSKYSSTQIRPTSLITLVTVGSLFYPSTVIADRGPRSGFDSI